MDPQDGIHNADGPSSRFEITGHNALLFRSHHGQRGLSGNVNVLWEDNSDTHDEPLFVEMVKSCFLRIPCKGE